MRRLLALVLLARAALAWGQYALVDSSHSGAVNDLVYDAERGLLFSAGQDGTVRIWEPGGRLRYSLRVSHRPVQRLALHPSLPQFSALVGEALKTDTLAAWDWERERELFSLRSDTQLLHLAYAPQGDYLAYSRADFQSLAAVDARSGSALGLLRNGFGIVSFFAISRNGNTVMGYQPSGWITYWDLQADRRLRQLRTLTDLSLIRITPSNRHILAAADGRLVAVDLLSGALAAQLPAPGLARLALAPGGDELAVEWADGLQRWHFSGSDFLPAGPPVKLEPALSALAFGPEGLYAGDREGTLSLVDQTGGRRLLARDVILPVGGLAFRGAAAALSTPEGIFLFRSPALSASLPLDQAEEPELNRLPSPFPGSFHLEFLDDQRLLAWREEPGALATVDLATGESRAMAVAISSPLQQVSVGPRGLILVERSGLCRILDPQSLETRFSYAARAVNRLTPTRGDLLVGAGTAGFGSSLFQINSRTGETVPLGDPSLFVYDLLYSPSRAALYSLAVESSSGGSRTVLAAHTGRQLDSRRVLAVFEGEDLRASLAEDEDGRLYCSLGFGPVAVWDGSTLAWRENPGAVARRLAVHAGRLYAVNTDSSISIWDSPGQLPWRMYLFLDGGWALLGPQGQVYGSPGARRYLAGQS
jgi:hypothetical protein